MRLKIIIGLISCLISNLVTYSQVSGLEIIDQASSHRYYAYLLFNNEVKGFLENRNCQSFFLSTDNGTIVRDTANSCKYIFRPTKYERAKIFYKEIINQDTVVITQKEVFVRPFPFTATVRGRTGNISMTKYEIINYPLRVEALNTGLSASLPIKKFNIKILRDKELIYNEEVKNYSRAKFVDLSNNLSMLENGDLIIYSNIEYDYSGYRLKAQDITIKVKPN